MARARNIKPSLFKNEVLGQADPLLTLLFEGLWCLADKEGRLEDRPLRIKAEIFPYRENLDINGYLTELDRLEFIQRFRVGNLAIIQVVNFKKHQTPHKTEKDSELPANPHPDAITVKPPLNNGEKTEPLPPDSLLLITDSKPTSPPSGEVPPGFESFWKSWPKSDRKQAKGKCLTAWKKANAERSAADILAHIESLKASDGWRKGFIPAPLVYLNEKRWEGAEYGTEGKFDGII